MHVFKASDPPTRVTAPAVRDVTMWRSTPTSVLLWRSSNSRRMTPGISSNCSLPSFTWATRSLRVSTTSYTWTHKLAKVSGTTKHMFYCMLSGTTANNLEVCHIVKSSHFNMVSELLEVCLVCLFLLFINAKTRNWTDLWWWSHDARWPPTSWRRVWLSAPSWQPERLWPERWPLLRLLMAGMPLSK